MLHLSPATRSLNENPEKLGCSILFMTNSLKLEIKVLVQYSTGYLKRAFMATNVKEIIMAGVISLLSQNQKIKDGKCTCVTVV